MRFRNRPIAARCDTCPCRGMRVSMLGGRTEVAKMEASEPGNKRTIDGWGATTITGRGFMRPSWGGSAAGIRLDCGRVNSIPIATARMIPLDQLTHLADCVSSRWDRRGF